MLQSRGTISHTANVLYGGYTTLNGLYLLAMNQQRFGQNSLLPLVRTQFLREIRKREWDGRNATTKEHKIRSVSPEVYNFAIATWRASRCSANAPRSWLLSSKEKDSSITSRDLKHALTTAWLTVSRSVTQSCVSVGSFCRLTVIGPKLTGACRCDGQ